MPVKVSFESLGPSAEQAVGSGLTGSVGVERVDGVTLAAGAILAGIDESSADVDEVTLIDLARGFKECIRCRDVQSDEIEPADLRWSNAAGCAMDDGVRLEVEDGCSRGVVVGDIDLLDGDAWDVLEQLRVGGPHQQMHPGGRMLSAHVPDDVVAECAGCSGDQNPL
jgi:hypothetical protein